jgi:rhamnosyltransferase subunit B
VTCGKRRIVLTTLGSLGDLHPMMGLALGLQARGHDVTLATSDFYREKIERAGLTFAAIRPIASADDEQILRQVMDSKKGPEFLLRTLLLPHLREMYEDLLAATEAADFLLSGEIVLAAPLVAAKRQLPWAGAILAPFSLFSAHDPSVLPVLPWATQLTRAPVLVQQLLLGAAKLATRGWDAPIVALRRTLGLPPTVQPLFRDRFSPLLNLALFSRLLGGVQPDWPANTAQTGFVFYDQSQESAAVSPQLDAFLAQGPAPIVFTLGSAAVMDAGGFFEESAAAARQIGARAVLLMGKNPLPEQSDHLLACDYAPYSQVFPRSACVVHQGGVGTTAEALRAGIPQLVMPYAFDQPDNAERITRRGVGLTVVRHEYRADRVARSLNQLLTGQLYPDRARDMGRHVAAEDGLSRACEAIENTLARRQRAS